MVTVQTLVGELEDREDAGYYFKYLGGVCFHPRVDEAGPGNAALVAVSNRHGLTLFSDLSGPRVRPLPVTCTVAGLGVRQSIAFIPARTGGCMNHA